MNKRKTRTIAEALAEGLRRAEEVGECLEWQGPFGGNGAVPSVRSREGFTYTQNYSATRLIWEAAHGEVPEGKLVYRKCCNNACVNIDHLKVGTRKEWGAWRRKAGMAKHSPATVAAITAGMRRIAKNTAEQVGRVCDLTREGVKVDDIVAATGVSYAMVIDIQQGRSWKNVARGVFAGLGA